MEPVFNEKVAKRLRELRDASNYTQRDLSKFLNIQRQAYSHYERGQRTPSTEILIEIGSFYDLSLDELLQLESPSKLRETAEYGVHHDDGRIPVRLSKAELDMIHELRKLPAEDQREIKEFVHFKKILRDKDKNKDDDKKA